MEDQERIQNEINALNQTKSELETDVNQKNATITQLDNDIASRNTTRDSLNSEITTLLNTKNETEAAITIDKSTKSKYDEEIINLSSNRNKLNEDIKTLEDDKRKLEANVKQWREKNDLFSNDIAGISEDSSTQRAKYSIGIGLAFSASIIFMWILISSVKTGTQIPSGVESDLIGNPRLLFLVFLLMRISLVGSLFVLIFVFINLTRGFVSQFIRTQEKMTAVRILDFLVSKIGLESAGFSEAEKIQFETKKLEKQKDLLNMHLPSLIEYSPSSFDKLSKTKSPDELIMDLIKTGKLEIPKRSD